MPRPGGHNGDTSATRRRTRLRWRRRWRRTWRRWRGRSSRSRNLSRDDGREWKNVYVDHHGSYGSDGEIDGEAGKPESSKAKSLEAWNSRAFELSGCQAFRLSAQP